MANLSAYAKSTRQISFLNLENAFILLSLRVTRKIFV